MNNTSPPPRRCYLSMFWNTDETEVNKHYETVHAVMDALIKGGKTEQEAQTMVEYLWSEGRKQGYDDAEFDANATESI